MTIEAIRALNRADLVLIPRKGAEKADLAELRREICARYLENPATRLVEFDLPRARRARRATAGASRPGTGRSPRPTARLARRARPADGTVALLVWGDPSLYDSTLRILEQLRAIAGSPSSSRWCPASPACRRSPPRHGMALNAIGGEVLVTTGRRLREARARRPTTCGDARRRLRLPRARRRGFDIHWGAYLGMAGEIVIAGPLAEVARADRRGARRGRARARVDHGYLSAAAGQGRWGAGVALG